MFKKSKKQATLVVIALILTVIFAAAIFYFSFETSSQSSAEGNVKFRALVADSLMEDYPNPELINYIVSVLEKAGFQVDVVTGPNVNLTLYSKLTEYSVIILRVHGGKAVYETSWGEVRKINGLFTGVLWEDKYSYLKRTWLATDAVPYGSNKTYLAVLPGFFLEKLSGKFSKDAVMIVASCYSLYTYDVADALARKGLKTFIGWEGPVTLNHMDNVVKELIEKVFLENKSWEQAVIEVNKELGPDPLHKEYLKIVIYK